jgi:hypothetical protein
MTRVARRRLPDDERAIGGRMPAHCRGAAARPDLLAAVDDV